MSTILVVDDMAVFREPIAASIEMAGYDVRCAADGLEALTLMQQSRPDLVLLDMAMPKLDGLGVLRQMRATKALKDVPVVLLTAVSDKDHIVEAAKLGVREYLLKSTFSLQELIRRIRKDLAAHQSAGGDTGDAEPAAEPATESFGQRAAQTTPAERRQAGRDDASIDAGDDPSPAASRGTAADASGFDSAVVLPPDGDIKSLKPVISRSEMNERIEQSGELKAMSPSVSEVLKISRNPNCSVEQLARAIKRDQAIALKILKLANSAVYTRGEPVESVQKAVTRIGIQQIRQAVMNITVVESLSVQNAEDCLDVAAFWEHSIATGLIAAQLTQCQDVGADGVDLAFTMGLIHDVGRLVYTDILGDLYTRVMKTAAALRQPLDVVESRMLLINHADVMDRVLHKWRFPRELVNPVAFHHLDVDGIRHMARTTFPAVATLALANRLAHALLLGGSGNDMIFPVEPFTDALEITGEQMIRIETETPDETDDMKIALLCHMERAAWRRTHHVLRKRFSQTFLPLVASVRPAFDPVRMFCHRLADRSNEAPNVAVAYMSAGRDRAPLSDALLAAERDAHVPPLPLILVSNTGQTDLDPAAMRGRRTIKLPMPMPIDSFIAAVNELTADETATELREVA